jgi:acetylornithine deacetylase/succinyl-diaminopimelate desuccinylase-like protein
MHNTSHFLITSILCLVSFGFAAAQRPASVQEQVRAYRVAHEKEIVGEFVRLLSLPNRATDTQDIERNAEFIKKMLENRGVTVRMLRVPGAPPVVLGELRTPGVRPAIGIYAHYDGQPVDPAQWLNPPFSPVVRDQNGKDVEWEAAANFDPEWRIYARSASDDKAPIEAAMAALDALRASSTPLSVNVEFMFEGEEEAGSIHLPQILRQHPDALETEIWLLCDGPVHQSRRMQVFFGARGETDLEITTYGPARALHSGHYGNWAPNPIVLLTHLIDSMRDMDGKILIPGFYDDVRPLTATEKQALAQTPAADEQLKQELAIRVPEGGGVPLAEQILRPALNVHGIQAGHVGAQGANVINTEAEASIDFRLVPNQTPEKVRERVEDHITRQGFFIVHDNPDTSTRQAHAHVVKLQWGSGYPPYRASMENTAAQGVIRTIERATGGPIIQVVTLGGSVPMYLFEGNHHAPVIGVPIANHDNNQHAANENLRLQNMWDAIQVYAAIFAKLDSGHADRTATAH